MTISSQETLRMALEALDAMKATEVCVLDVTGISMFTDHFIVASVISQTQMRGVRRDLDRRLKEAGQHGPGVDGEDSPNWMVLDLGDVVIHIFEPQTRRIYNLESLWGDAIRLDTGEILTA